MAWFSLKVLLKPLLAAQNKSSLGPLAQQWRSLSKSSLGMLRGGCSMSEYRGWSASYGTHHDEDIEMIIGEGDGMTRKENEEMEKTSWWEPNSSSGTWAPSQMELKVSAFEQDVHLYHHCDHRSV